MTEVITAYLFETSDPATDKSIKTILTDYNKWRKYPICTKWKLPDPLIRLANPLGTGIHCVFRYIVRGGALWTLSGGVKRTAGSHPPDKVHRALPRSLAIHSVIPGLGFNRIRAGVRSELAGSLWGDGSLRSALLPPKGTRKLRP